MDITRTLFICRPKVLEFLLPCPFYPRRHPVFLWYLPSATYSRSASRNHFIQRCLIVAYSSSCQILMDQSFPQMFYMTRPPVTHSSFPVDIWDHFQSCFCSQHLWFIPLIALFSWRRLFVHHKRYYFYHPSFLWEIEYQEVAGIYSKT